MIWAGSPPRSEEGKRGSDEGNNPSKSIKKHDMFREHLQMSELWSTGSEY